MDIVTAPHAENRRRTEGGGAWAQPAKWHVLWTHSHCEQMVCSRLLAKNFHPFLPKVLDWSWRSGQQHKIGVPLFPGYLFLHDTIDRYAYFEVVRTKGLVSFLGERWDHLAAVPDSEIEGIQKLIDTQLPLTPHAYLREGRRVRVVRGPLQGVEGVLLQLNPKKGTLVVSVHLLQRSVSVQVDCAEVVGA